MLKLNVLELLKEKERTKYWLFVQLGMTYTNYNNLIMNRTKSIKYDTVEKLCEILECEPNDLFVKSDEDVNRKQASKVTKPSKKTKPTSINKKK